jgi:hypothetical protein
VPLVRRARPASGVKGLLLPRLAVWYIGDMAEVSVGLADAIAALRAELMAAMNEGASAPMRFRLAPVEMSLQVAVTKEGEGRIGWKVLGLGGSYASAVTQTLSLRLEPLWQQADGAYSEDFSIASQTAKSPRFGPQAEETR